MASPMSWVTKTTVKYANGNMLVGKMQYNKKGLLTSVDNKSESTMYAVNYRYEWDKAGNLKALHSMYDYVYTNKYKAGKLVKRGWKSWAIGSGTEKYTYKKVSVPAKYASLVKSQQAQLLNHDVGFAFPSTLQPGYSVS